MANEKSQKVATHNYECVSCYYFSNNKFDYKKHISTDKHCRLTKANNLSQKSQKVAKNSCICGKSYTHSSSLSKHKKICPQLFNDNINSEKPEITPELLIELIHQNKEMQQALIDQNKHIIDYSKMFGKDYARICLTTIRDSEMRELNIYQDNKQTYKRPHYLFA